VSNQNSSESTNIAGLAEYSDTSTVVNMQSTQASGVLAQPLNESNKDTKPPVVSLIRTIHILAHHSAVVPVKVKDVRGTVLVEAGKLFDDCLQVDDLLVTVDQDGISAILVSNHSKSSYQLMSGVELARASEMEPDVDGEENESLVDKFNSSEEDLTCSDLSSTDVPDTAVEGNSSTAQEQISEECKQWMIRTLSKNTDHCSYKREQWRQQQLRETFIDSRTQ